MNGSALSILAPRTWLFALTFLSVHGFAIECPTGMQRFDATTCMNAQGERWVHLTAKNKWCLKPHTFSGLDTGGKTLIDELDLAPPLRRWVENAELSTVTGADYVTPIVASKSPAIPLPIESRVYHACPLGFKPFALRKICWKPSGEEVAYIAESGREGKVIRAESNDLLLEVKEPGSEGVTRQTWVGFPQLANVFAAIVEKSAKPTWHACPKGFRVDGAHVCTGPGEAKRVFYALNNRWGHLVRTIGEEFLVRENPSGIQFWVTGGLLSLVSPALGEPRSFTRYCPAGYSVSVQSAQICAATGARPLAWVESPIGHWAYAIWVEAEDLLVEPLGGAIYEWVPRSHLGKFVNAVPIASYSVQPGASYHTQAKESPKAPTSTLFNP